MLSKLCGVYYSKVIAAYNERISIQFFKVQIIDLCQNNSGFDRNAFYEEANDGNTFRTGILL